MVYNMHERFVRADPERIWEVLASIGSEGDRLWPEGKSTFRLPAGLAPGAPVEHSALRYRVKTVEPGRRLWFDTGAQLSEGHGFTLIERDGGTLVRHELKGRTGGMFRLMWPLVIRRKHNVVIERVLENLEREATRTGVA
ncbi:hypothetical protein OHR68_13170 [Spirillospora sp. NBC_00431]